MMRLSLHVNIYAVDKMPHFLQMLRVVGGIFFQPMVEKVRVMLTTQRYPLVENIFYKVGYNVSRFQIIIDSLYFNPFQKLRTANKSDMVLPREQLIMNGAKFLFEYIIVYGILIYATIEGTISSMNTTSALHRNIAKNHKYLETAAQSMKMLQNKICELEMRCAQSVEDANKFEKILESKFDKQNTAELPVYIKLGILEKEAEQLRKCVEEE